MKFKTRFNRLIGSAVIYLALILLFTKCTEPEPLPFPDYHQLNIFLGQVYNLSHPGPIPVGWEPPPYEAVCTVIIEDVNQKYSLAVITDNKGRFSAVVPDGEYYLRVKDSMISSVSGPYLVKHSGIMEVKVYFDNGMR